LRQREDQIQSLKSEAKKTETELRKTQEQLAYIQEQGLSQASHLLPEQSHSLFSVKSVKIDPLHTGFIVQDDPLKSKLNVVVTPFDDAGEIIRVPGTIEIVVTDSSNGEGANVLTQELGRWNYDLHETAKSWQRGFFISGFQYLLPVVCEEHRTIKVFTTFTTTDNRVFTAAHRVQCTDLLAPMPAKPSSTAIEPARLETSVSWEKDVSPGYR
jgi:hypothetical protein